MKWRYGITAVPGRLNTLLPATLASLRNAGFPAPVIFIDGIVEWSSNYELVMHQHVGHLRNYLTAVAYLYLTDPDADRYAIFEDDCLACSNLRNYIDACPFPEKGYLNLLTHEQNLVNCGPSPGWHESNQMGRGAVGLVFNNDGMRSLLGEKLFTHSYIEKHGVYGADGVICLALKALGFTEYVHNPSLLQHVGEQSILGHKFSKVSTFLGEHFNPMELLEQPNA